MASASASRSSRKCRAFVAASCVIRLFPPRRGTSTRTRRPARSDSTSARTPPFRKREWEEDLAGKLVRPFPPPPEVEPGREHPQELRVGLPVQIPDRAALPPEKLPSPDPEHDGRGPGAVAGHPEDVLAPALDPLHPLLPRDRLKPPEHVPVPGGGLEAKRPGLLLHLPRDAGADPLDLPPEDPQHAVDRLPVLLLRLEPDTGSGAPPDMVVEAGAGRSLAGEVVAARADAVEPLHELERLAHGPDGGIRSEVARGAVAQLPGDEDPRERLPDGHLHERIALVVAELDVESGPVLLDQVRLEHEGLGVGAHEDRVGVGGPARELAQADPAPRVAGEVAPDPGPDGVRLADVEDPPRSVPEQIDARTAREAPQLPRVDRHRIAVPGGGATAIPRWCAGTSAPREGA